MMKLPLYQTIKKLLKRAWILFAFFVILIAILSSFFRALTPFAMKYRQEIEARLSETLKKTVVIGTIETGWYWFQPVIRLSPVSVMENKQPVMQLQKLEVGIDLLSSLWHWRIEPETLYIDALHLTLRETSNHWKVQGLIFKKNNSRDDAEDEKNSFEASGLQSFLGFSLFQKTIVIRHMRLTVLWQDGKKLDVSEMNLRLTKHFDLHRVRLETVFLENRASMILVLESSFDGESPKNGYGRAFLSTRGVPLWLWRRLLPSFPVNIKQGSGDLQLWLDWGQGKITALQSRVDFHDLVWVSPFKKTYVMPRFLANLAFHATADGFTVSGDHVRMAIGSMEYFKSPRTTGLKFMTWPENAFMVKYQKEHGLWDVYLQHLLLDSALTLLPDTLNNGWIEKLKKAYGHFETVHFIFNPEGLTYLLARFSKAGFKGNESFPKAENLSGALNWTPKFGRLELDTENALLTFKQKKPLFIKVLNTVLNWKVGPKGLNISLPRFLVEHENLTLNANGELEDITPNWSGLVNMAVQLSMNHAERWFAYLPQHFLKPGLNRWLKTDIHQLDRLLAEAHIQGQLEDFPFDNTEGKFLVRAYLQGMNFHFAPGWLPARHVDAYLSLKKRNLKAHIVQAMLGDNLISDASLHIDDIGLQHEILGLKAAINTTLSHAISFLLASPLHDKFSFFQTYLLNGFLGVALDLEVPLYTETAPVKVSGDAVFKDASLVFHQGDGAVALKALAGTLKFNEEKILEGVFNATLWGESVWIKMASYEKPLPHLEMEFQGKTHIDRLPKQFMSPFIKGFFSWTGRMIFSPDNGQMKSIIFNTSLTHLISILPPPFTKRAEEILPLMVQWNVLSPGVFRLDATLGTRLSALLFYENNKSGITFQRGTVQLGDSSITEPVEGAGLTVLGQLQEFSLPAWRAVLANGNEGGFFPTIHLIQVFIEHLMLDGSQYENVGLKITPLSDFSFSIDVTHDILKGHMVYTPKTNTWKGTLASVNLTSFTKVFAMDKPGTFSMGIDNMPNLDLDIEALEINGISLGHVEIKTQLQAGKWSVDAIKIIGPYWNFSLNGFWNSLGKRQQTTFSGRLELSDLAKFLAHFSITPVVEARKGIIEIEGTSNTPFYALSFGNIEGQVGVLLKHGRITHLSPETEEKLGLGKVLSILSLQTIPRRLTLDFSDLSHKGYSFDEFRGDFLLAAGKLSTTNSYIDGPIAYGSMKGNLDLIKHLYHLEVRISPHVTASLPVVATIAGGPVAGIATWAVSKIINQGVQKISGYTYRITGPWDAPIVKQVSMTRKK